MSITYHVICFRRFSKNGFSIFRKSFFDFFLENFPKVGNFRFDVTFVLDEMWMICYHIIAIHVVSDRLRLTFFQKKIDLVWPSSVQESEKQRQKVTFGVTLTNERKVTFFSLNFFDLKKIPKKNSNFWFFRTCFFHARTDPKIEKTFGNIEI